MTQWKELSLKEVTDLIKDGSHGTHKDVSSGIALLSAKDIKNGEILYENEPRQISHDDFNQIHKNYHLQNGDILLTIVGTLGRVAKVINYENQYTLQRSVAILRFKNKAIINDFAYYLLTASKFQNDFKRRENKGAQGGVYLGEIAKIKVKVPDVLTQKKIVDILETWDECLDMLDRKIEAKKNIKKGLMQQLLTGKVRLPGYKSEWTETHLSAIAKVDSGFGFPEKFQGHSDKEIPFIKVSDMNLSGNKTKITVWNNSVTADEMKQMKARTFPLGSIVFPKIGAAINTNKKRLLTRPTIVDNNVMVLMPIETVSANFLFQWMLAFDLKRWANDSGVPSMRKSEVEAHLLRIPSDFDEMREIGEILNVADDEIEALSLLKRCVLDQKKYLLNNLVTGKISTSKSTEVKEAVHA